MFNHPLHLAWAVCKCSITRCTLREQFVNVQSPFAPLRGQFVNVQSPVVLSRGQFVNVQSPVVLSRGLIDDDQSALAALQRHFDCVPSADVILVLSLFLVDR